MLSGEHLGVTVLAGIEVFFFPRCSHDAVFGIFDENSVDNTWMFPLLWSSACTELRTFQLLVLPRQQGVGRDRTRTADPD